MSASDSNSLYDEYPDKDTDAMTPVQVSVVPGGRAGAVVATPEVAGAGGSPDP